MREHLKSNQKNLKKKSFYKMGPEPRFEPESRDPQSRRMTTYPDLNPGRPASTGPKPVPFGLSGTPAYKKERIL